jgi:hypothetical protein
MAEWVLAGLIFIYFLSVFLQKEGEVDEPTE